VLYIGKISGKKKLRMNLGMLDRFCPSLKTRALLNERTFDRSDKNNDRYVIPMNRKKNWTNRWM
jgi:hypothetical protein